MFIKQMKRPEKRKTIPRIINSLGNNFIFDI